MIFEFFKNRKSKISNRKSFVVVLKVIMKSIKYISIILILLFTSTVFSQVKFQAKVSKKKLGVNERLRVDFEMNKDGDNFNPPSFENFKVIGGPNTSVSNSWINGKRSFAKTYSYFLAPVRVGKFKINQATIEIDREVYKSQVVQITVTKAVQKPKNGNDSDFIASDNIHLVAEISNNKPYLNEALTVVYKLYVSPNTGVSNWRETDNPKYDGFWSQNIDIKGLKILNGEYKGEDYRYVVLRKTVLYPQKTGKLEIEPLVLDVSIDVPTKRRDIFGGRIMRTAHETITAGKRSIEVRPLPEEGKPSDFTGAVGVFDFKLMTTKSSLNANESLQAKVEVSGKGNLKLIKLPKLKVPSSLEVYEPEHSERVRTNLGGMQGRISDTYTIVPQYKGKYPLPIISFSYFDPKTETYKRISSGEKIINVIEGPVNGSDDNDISSVNGDNKRVIKSNDQFAFIKTNSNLVSKSSNYFFKSKLFWSSLLLPLLAIPLAIVYRRKREERSLDVVGNKTRKADRLAKKYLGAAKKALGQKEAFYVALEKALHNYLKGKLSIETSDLSKDRVKSILTERQVNRSTVEGFDALLENCELARYTPITNVTMQQDYEKAAETISLIDKEIR